MRKAAAVVAVGVVIVLLGISAAAQTGDRVAKSEPAQKAVMPEFSASTLDGHRLKSDELRGKIVLLQFWTPGWDGGDRDISLLRTLKKLYAKDGLVVIGFVRSVPTEKDIERVKDDWHKIDWPQVFDNGELKEKFGIVDSPTYCIVGHDGFIRTCVAYEQEPEPCDASAARAEYGPVDIRRASQRGGMSSWPNCPRQAQALRTAVEKAVRDLRRQRKPASPESRTPSH